VFCSLAPAPRGPTPLEEAMAKLKVQSDKLSALAREWKEMDERHSAADEEYKRKVAGRQTLQDLLNEEARLSNELFTVTQRIEEMRGPAPSCYGEDDCSTAALSTCPWRMTCGRTPR
jgi:hypothetical protein